MVLLFRDPEKARQKDSSELHLLNQCDEYLIPVATNIATAEVLIQGLQRHSVNSSTMQDDMNVW